MKLKNLLFDTLDFESCILGVGTFDGVHLGHKKLIDKVKQESLNKNIPAVIFTFDHSPKRFIEPEKFLGYLTTPAEKFNLIFSRGIDYIVFRPFDEEFAKLDYKQFINEILIEKLKASVVVVGFNFLFGKDKKGNAKILQEEFRACNKECIIIEPVKIENVIVSSSIIRKAISKGDFELSNKLLGRVASLTGEVIHGDHRGRTMGYPTANLLLENSQIVLPPNGVYGCFVETPEGNYPSLVNIGVRPTFNKKSLLLEAHLMGFSGNLYHRIIRINFLKRIRNEIKFPNVAALIEQIKKDEQIIKDYFKKHGF